MKRIIYLIVLAGCCFCAGCTRVVEPNDLAYIVAIGIDRSEEAKNYEYTVQIANPMAISGGSSEEGGEGGEKTISEITVSAPSVFSAVSIASHLYSKQLSLAHTKLIAFSDDIARSEGLSDMSETIARSEEIRPNTYLTVVLGSAKDYLSEIKPTNEVNPVQYYQVIYDSNKSVYIPKNPCQDFYAYELSGERENVLPLSAIQKEDNNSQNIVDSGFGYLMKNSVAGNVTVESEQKTQAYGMAIFSGGVMVAEAGAVETELYNILTGDYIRSEVVYSDENAPNGFVTMQQAQQRRPIIKVDVSSDIPKIKAEIFLEADLRTVSEDYLLEEDVDNFENNVKNKIKKAAEDFLYKTSREYKSDIVGFGSYAKRYFAAFEDFKAYNWKEKYTRAEFEVVVNFHMRRSGLIDRQRG